MKKGQITLGSSIVMSVAGIVMFFWVQWCIFGLHITDLSFGTRKLPKWKKPSINQIC